MSEMLVCVHNQGSLLSSELCHSPVYSSVDL